MEGESIRVLLVGTGDDFGVELEGEGFELARITDLASLGPGSDQDAVIVALDETGPLEALETLRFKTPAAAVLVLTTSDHEADGAVALHAGAEDHLERGSIPHGLLPRAIRYAVERRRLRRELATVDELTRLPNLRGFVAIAEHQLRMADRAGSLVVLLFVRFDDHRAALAEAELNAADQLAVEAAEVLISAIRDSDLPARIAEDTFCVLLSGEARGAEVVVLSRLVEAIAVHDANRPQPQPLALSVGSAIYDPAHPVSLEGLLRTAQAEMRPHSSEDR
ncbi:MAG: GGDEF domain-containing protein [Actinomycetota bacterium]|nr:GGDEF domain-containing protein [Actinomycetota bacterium]